MPAGAIVILGNVGLFVGDKPADLRRQLRKALALMVAAQGRRVRRQEIAAAVWDDEDRDVRTLMWSLRRVLRDCDSGFDVPPDKSKDGNYLLVVNEPGTLEESADAFRFLDLIREAETLWEEGDESAAVDRLTVAAGLWGGEPFAGLWPGGPPEACRRLRADLEHARDFLVRSLAEAALCRGGPYEAARAYRGRAVGAPGEGQGESGAPGGDAAWLAGFLIALHDRPGSDEADRLVAARRGLGAGVGAAREGGPGDDAVARADDLMLLAAEGIDVHRPLAVAPRPPVAGSPPVTVGRDAELAAFRRMLDEVRAGHPAALAVRGASGRGKTRLAAELAASAVTAGVPVVLISAARPGDLRPWQELAERLWPAACRDVGTGRDRVAARLTLGQRRALLDFVAPRAGAPARPDPDQAQQVRFAEITRALGVLARTVAARRGLIVALDDADRLTERGRELLGPFLAGLRDAPVGIALFGRDNVPWTDAVLAARADTVRLLLGPLPEQAIGRWLRQVRGAAPTGEEIRLIARATAGEPVRIRDQVAAMSAVPPGSAQEHPREAGAPGAALRPPSAWLAAAAITAADLVIDTALVARMLDLPDQEADREEGDARRQAWIDTSAGVRFTHGSHRDDVIARLDADPALRRSLHRRAFEALTDRVRGKTGKDGMDDPDPSLPVRIAGHALGADRDLPAAEAARAFLAAARAERASGEAAEAWARAGIVKGSPDLLSQSDPEVFRQIEGHAFFAIWRVGLALASSDASDLPAAAAHVRALDEDYQGFDAFPPHGWTVAVAALLAETCLAMSPAVRHSTAQHGAAEHSAVDDPLDGLLPDIAGRLRVILSRYAGEFVLAGWPSVLLGPAECFSGLLAMATGEYEEALHLFDAVADKVAGAPPQAARLQANRARALLRLAQCRGGRAGPAAAARLLTEAGATADRLGMRALAREASELLSEC